ncbi:M23 family metallopeptidase [candidate division KSB1 bacterium]|nr:M23 family metallopeptidase [candidate division KSB1 bacterium]
MCTIKYSGMKKAHKFDHHCNERDFSAIMTPVRNFFVFVTVLFLGFTSLGASPYSASDKSAESEIRLIHVRYGMTLGNLLRKNGIPTNQIQPLLNAFKEVYDPRDIRAGEKLKFEFTTDGDFLGLYYQPSADKKIRILSNDTLSTFTAFVDSLPTKVETKLLVGTVETSLYEAVLQAGESPELIMAFSDIFQWDIDFFIDPRVGDSFGIYFEKEYVFDRESGLPTFLRYGKILAAAYAQKDTTLIAFGFSEDDDALKYYDENGKSFQKTFLKSPLNYRRISSYFTNSRFHPILKKRRAHTGVDFAAHTGTPVVSSADGTVLSIGWKGGYGKCIELSHKNGTFVTLYGHLSRYANNLRAGQKVKQNQLIGYVGQTGRATGPHLHYTMYYNGRAIDPLKLRPTAGNPLQADQMLAFQEKKKELLQKLGLLDSKNFSAILLKDELSAR